MHAYRVIFIGCFGRTLVLYPLTQVSQQDISLHLFHYLLVAGIARHELVQTQLLQPIDVAHLNGREGLSPISKGEEWLRPLASEPARDRPTIASNLLGLDLTEEENGFERRGRPSRPRPSEEWACCDEPDSEVVVEANEDDEVTER